MSLAVVVCHFAATLATPARTARGTSCVGRGKRRCVDADNCAWQLTEGCTAETSGTDAPEDLEFVGIVSPPTAPPILGNVVAGIFRQIAVDVDFKVPVRRYLIEDLISGVNIDLTFADGTVPADAAETPKDGTIATAHCTNQFPEPIQGAPRYSNVTCLVGPGGFSLDKRARARNRRGNYAEGGRPGISVGTRTWIVTMLQIPGEHIITESERRAVSCYLTLARTTIPTFTLTVLSQHTSVGTYTKNYQ
jgi:hypothetical protein